MQKGEECKPYVTYDYYFRHFVTHYKLYFGVPRSDTCQTCDEIENHLKVEKDPILLKEIQTKKEVHLKKSKQFYYDLTEIQKQAKCKEDIEVISFDFQQNMPLPAVPSGDVFYKRQLWVYNFAVCSAKKGKSYCYMYDENIGCKGQNDVISLLDLFLRNEVDENVKTMYIFSDNCAAQNKNYALIQYLYTLVKGFKRFDKVIHRYPEPGHSYLPCDRTFGNIEQERRKRERMYVPKDYQDLVRNTSKNFLVIDVKQTMFLDFSTHFNVLFKPPASVRAQTDDETPTPRSSKKIKRNPKGLPPV